MTANDTTTASDAKAASLSRAQAVTNVETTVGPWQVRCGPLDHKEDQLWWIELRYSGSDGAIEFSATLGPHEALAIGTALVEMARNAQTES